MKLIIGNLLLSLGIYCFAFGLYLATQSLQTQENEKLRRIVNPEVTAPATQDSIGRSRSEDYPIGLFLLCASGTTFGMWGGIHLLVRSRQPVRQKKR